LWSKNKNDNNTSLNENAPSFNNDSVQLNNIKLSKIKKIEIPQTNSQDIIITHTGYSLSYNETHEQSNWVAYELTREETTKLFERTDKFIPDPEVKTETANGKDYYGTVYDRGHLAPAADMGWSSTTMAESFFYSNMSPQTKSFNRGIWKKLEELVRSWAIENDTIYIVTGPVLTSGLQTIGANKVSVPNYFYKVILDYSEPSIKGIGFILPNIGSSAPSQNFAVTIDSVEKFTGIDFFPLLPDKQEELIEKTLCVNCWTWKSTKTKIEKDGKTSSLTVQCSGITKTGKRCKRMTTNSNGRCFQH